MTNHSPAIVIITRSSHMPEKLCDFNVFWWWPPMRMPRLNASRTEMTINKTIGEGVQVRNRLQLASQRQTWAASLLASTEAQSINEVNGSSLGQQQRHSSIYIIYGTTICTLLTMQFSHVVAHNWCFIAFGYAPQGSGWMSYCKPDPFSSSWGVGSGHGTNRPYHLPL